jgi:ubiquinone/menaquinone biosynthesis C-methylase UbiE
MNEALNQRHRDQGRLIQKLAFWTITLMHDNPLLPYLKNPYKLLKAAGLRTGQKVVEVGCGPGYFTLPAARIVGQEGLLYAVDVNPFAVERVRAEISREKLNNVLPMLKNASNTGLPQGIIDLAFVFGLPYVAGGLKNLLSEMHRVLKPEGVLAFRVSGGSKKTLFREMEEQGFVCGGNRKRVLLFKKRKDQKRWDSETSQNR